MLISTDTRQFLTDTASAVRVSLCWHNAAGTESPRGYVQALAARCAR